jgi:hypothetical protein
MSRFNPHLAALALGNLTKLAQAEKQGFVPMGPDAQVAQQLNPGQPQQPRHATTAWYAPAARCGSAAWC